MKFTAAERKNLRRALMLAIDYDEALIDAYRVAWHKRRIAVHVLSEDGKRV